MKRIICLLCLLVGHNSIAQIVRVEPPNWWAGLKDPNLQLLVYGNGIGKAEASINHKGVHLENTHTAESPNYLFLDLKITNDAEAGKFDVVFNYPDGKQEQFEYELQKREKASEDFIGFNKEDVIYLITPDRFANGDSKNDVVSSMKEKKVDRTDDYARHGGDIRGIIQHLDYIEEMGFTAIWPSPLLENDMEEASYHGYAITDFYKVDPRFGSLEEYKELANKARERGMKLVMDQVANHAGIEHWWMKDLPFDDWINYQQRYTGDKNTVYSNHRRTTNQDLYASEIDKKKMTEGWFVDSMPDLNQENPFMARYLIQNSIWWIETLGLGGIRQDTYPYPDKGFMSDWAGAIMNEYPNFNIVGEEWSYNPLLIRYWQSGVENRDGYESNLPSTMDFAMNKQIIEALNEEEAWDKGLIKIYEGLANDFAYASPENILIFGDNHDKSRIYTQLGEDLTNTQMALGYLLVLPRIPQIYYGTEILMSDAANPGDHGLIRTDFPGGWDGDKVNAFEGKGLTDLQKQMQNFLKKLLNYRRNSKAIQEGKTIHFAPENGIYLLSRIHNDEKLVVILNKNEKPVSLNLERFEELGLEGTQMKRLVSEEILEWNEKLELQEKGIYILTTNFEN